jgi:uncharacterized protein YceK
VARLYSQSSSVHLLGVSPILERLQEPQPQQCCSVISRLTPLPGLPSQYVRDIDADSEADREVGCLHVGDHAIALPTSGVLAGHLVPMVIRLCHGLCRSNWSGKSRVEDLHLVHVLQHNLRPVW